MEEYSGYLMSSQDTSSETLQANEIDSAHFCTAYIFLLIPPVFLIQVLATMKLRSTTFIVTVRLGLLLSAALVDIILTNNSLVLFGL